MCGSAAAYFSILASVKNFSRESPFISQLECIVFPLSRASFREARPSRHVPVQIVISRKHTDSNSLDLDMCYKVFAGYPRNSYMAKSRNGFQESLKCCNFFCFSKLADQNFRSFCSWAESFKSGVFLKNSVWRGGIPPNYRHRLSKINNIIIEVWSVALCQVIFLGGYTYTPSRPNF